MSMLWGTDVSKPTYFQIQAGKLDQQVNAFIETHDKDGDKALSFNEVIAAGGLTGSVDFKASTSALTKSMWAAVSGPSNTVNAKEYAQYLISLDANQDTQITQDEADALSEKWTKQITKTPQTALKSIYQELVSTGQKFGIESIFDNAKEEELALGKSPTEAPSPVTREKQLSSTTSTAGMPTFQPLDLTTPLTDTVSPFLANPNVFDNTNMAPAFTPAVQGPSITLQDFMNVHATRNQPYINPNYLNAVMGNSTNTNTISSLFGQQMGQTTQTSLMNELIASMLRSNPNMLSEFGGRIDTLELPTV
ncbi:MAG: hypothetical protein ACK5T0_02960 [Vampirovibrionales bacterium]